MSLLLIDPQRCLRDGVCAEECPRLLIEMPAGGACPVEVEGAEVLCNACGHCLAVCPTEALSLRATVPADCPAVREELLPSAAQVEHFLRTRRSIRTFEPRPLPREVLEKLLDITRYAPSGGNRQPVEWLVVYHTEKVRRLAALAAAVLRELPDFAYKDTLAVAARKGGDLVCRSAPHLVIAHTPQGQQTDGVIALTYLELAAYSLGLGACWSGFFTTAAHNSAAIQEALGLPEGHVICGTMLVGFPTHRYLRIPPRREARVRWQ